MLQLQYILSEWEPSLFEYIIPLALDRTVKTFAHELETVANSWSATEKQKENKTKWGQNAHKEKQNRIHSQSHLQTGLKLGHSYFNLSFSFRIHTHHLNGLETTSFILLTITMWQECCSCLYTCFIAVSVVCHKYTHSKWYMYTSWRPPWFTETTCFIAVQTHE